MFPSHALLALSLLAPASAWMPGVDRDIFHEAGHNLFRRNVSEPEDINSKRWLPGHLPIRGVNLGSMFVFEPWLAHDYWEGTMGCVDSSGRQLPSEFDCVSHLGQQKANEVFQAHWRSWIVQNDIRKMADYGLNTIRVPVGYWMDESIVYSSEHFPQGGFQYLLQVCDWARQQGFYIILDLHGAPYSQAATPNADTGQYRSPGFYDNNDAYERSYKFLEWMTSAIHTHPEMANVGMIEVLNEPVQDQSKTHSLLNTYYPTAWSRIRAVEAKLNVQKNNLLHIQMMNEKWGSGNPNQGLHDLWFAAYDDHRYLKWAWGMQDSQEWYLKTSCNDDRGGNWPTIVGEFSLSTNNDEWPVASNKDFYHKWWAAQVRAYERQDGWIYWTWRTSGLNDPRWDYQMAVEAGIISKRPDDAYRDDLKSAC